jgi:phage terminase small subunit
LKGGNENMANAKKIKESLLKQLENKGANVEHFLGQIDSYIWYFNQEKAMQKDVKERGRTFKTISASGYEIEKENPSVKSALAYNKQQLSILKELGLTTSNCILNNGDDSEDDL